VKNSSTKNRELRSYFHRRLYLSLQSIRGRPVGSFMREMQNLEALDHESYRKITQLKLEKSLEHAKNHVPFYATGKWREVLKGENYKDIHSWPILERDMVQTSSHELIAPKNDGRISYRESSASTSNPIRVAWDQPAAAWNWSTEYQTMLWHGVDVGVKTIILWRFEERFVDLILNRHFFSTKTLTEEELERAARYVIAERPALAWGMPSAVAQLARYMGVRYPHESKPLVRFAKMGGEQVFPFQRVEIQNYLGARVVEIYGCAELGSIAGECPLGKLHIYTPHVHLEIFNGEDPAPPGEFGDIVGTTINNRAMPLIRYRIGDRGRISYEPCDCGLNYPVLEDLQGRLADTLLTYDGTSIHGSILGKAFDSYIDKPGFKGIRQVLFHQLSQFSWKIIVETQEGNDLMINILTEIVHKIFGTNCQVDIEFVPYIPREPSGKYRYYKASNGYLKTGKT
jgi:phenylacetate-CoA ligase